MKIKLPFVLLTLVTFLVFTSHVMSQNFSDVNALDGWNGTIKYFLRTTTRSSTGGGYNEWRIEVNVADGQITSKASNQFQSKYRGSCYSTISGSQETTESIKQFTFTLKQENNQVYFTVWEGMPVLTGKRTVCGKEESISQGDLALGLEEIKVGNDPEVLSADSVSRKRTTHGSEIFDEEIQVSVHLSRGNVDVELIVMPEGYDQWLPLPGKTPGEAGSNLDIGLKLQAKGGGEPKMKAKYFEIELQGVSKEPGIALNAPLTQPKNDFDLAFVPYGENEVSKEGQFQQVKAVEGKTGAAMISAFDGGAYGELVAYAILENGKRVKGKMFNEAGPSEVLIPKREPASKIAQSWLSKHGNPSDDDDQEKSPGNTYDGDGLTAYEEYRGIFSEGKYKRLDPRKKELGIQIASEADKHEFEAGISLLAKAAGIEVVILNEQELPPDRLLNMHNGYAHVYQQHGLRLTSGNLTDKVLGENRPTNVFPKTPKSSEVVVIDVQQAKTAYLKQVAINKAGGVNTPYSSEQNIATTVAHEIAHGIHVDHHGPQSKEINRAANTNSIIPFRIFDSFGDEITKRPFNIEGSIGLPENDESGDLGCIMAYTQAYQWVYKKTAEALFYYAVPPNPVGGHLCIGVTGSGINSGGKFFGNATTGNCLAQVKVRDD